jgi:hypothetical protein
MVSLVVLGLLLIWWLGELISAGRGFGFGDGRTYGRLGMLFPEFKYVDEYRMGRVLPSLVVNLGHRILPGPANVGSTVRLFRLMNLALLAGSAGLWYLIARHWRLRRPAAWIGFVGLLFSFANLKLAMYYPTLTDTAALAVAVLLLYVFLRGNWQLTAGIAAAGAFISPPLAVLALVLVALPRLPTRPREPATTSQRRLGWAGAAAVAVCAAGWLWHIDGRFEGWVVSGGEEAWRSWMWLSIGLAAAYLGLGALPFLESLISNGRSWLRQLAGSGRHRRRLLLRLGVVGVIVTAALALYQLGVEVTERDTSIIFDRMLYSAVARPLAFGVAHFMHFGPIVILAALVWPQLAAKAHEEGPGMVLLFMGVLVLGLTSESRTITAALPFVAAYTARAVDRYEWSIGAVAVFAATSIAVSRIWYPINQGPLEDVNYLEFPAQAYFMNFGPWLADRVFWIFAGACLGGLIITALLLRHAQGSVEPAGDPAGIRR